MSRNSVAILDIRSSEVTAVVGERGVNNTFVFNASHTEPYDGYEGGKFFDPKGLAEAIHSCINSVEKTTNSRIRKLWIGVPGEFLLVIPKEQKVGFSKKRRITERETEALFEGGKTEQKGYRLIRVSSMIYVTADNRRVVSPIGLHSTSLSAILSYFYCADYFAETMEKVFSGMKIAIAYLPTVLAMADYLIPGETRDEYAIFLDCGFLSSTIAVLFGGGILAEETHWVGKARIIVRIMETFGLDYDAASALLTKANLFVKGGGTMEFTFRNSVYEIDIQRLADVVKEGLDEICEAIARFVDDCSGRELDFKPIYISGEGLADIRGALEHLTRRLSRMTEMLTPRLPSYNKPAMSSRIALIDMACGDKQQNRLFKRIF